MKKEKLIQVTIKELAKDSGVNYEVLKIKQMLVTKIKAHCEKNKYLNVLLPN